VLRRVEARRVVVRGGALRCSGAGRGRRRWCQGEGGRARVGRARVGKARVAAVRSDGRARVAGTGGGRTMGWQGEVW
jgi:hypothetical protein